MTFEASIDNLCDKLAPVMELQFVCDLESSDASQILTDLMKRRQRGVPGTSSMILSQAETVLRLCRFQRRRRLLPRRSCLR